MVVELFSEVENKNIEATVWNTHPYKEDQLKTIVYINPVKDVRNLNIVFPCEDLISYYKSGVSKFVFIIIVLNLITDRQKHFFQKLLEQCRLEFRSVYTVILLILVRLYFQFFIR